MEDNILENISCELRNFSEMILSDSTVVISCIFENISQLKDYIESPPCYVYTLPWRILIILEKHKPTDKQFLGIFLQCQPNNVPQNWSCYAAADISLMPFRIDMDPITKSINHKFSASANDYGFKYFIAKQFILDSENGYCTNDSIAIQIHIMKIDIPHGISWNSKMYTGYVGLTNQGATCYMNSLLQTIFFTNELRHAIYCMPTEADNPRKSVAFALQRIFYDLQFNDKPVSTNCLTKSFGWNTVESFIQHDVQEFLRVLLTKIETKMKYTNLEEIVSKLFSGKMCSYIQCKNVNHNSIREDIFYDIQLSIKNKKNIYESFQDYVKSELLTGDNKYYADNFGLQEAEKRVIFKTLPPVLHLHLLRFQYDNCNDSYVKLNDYFEFYENINLSNFIDLEDTTDEINKILKAEYRLHAVLVHSGNNNDGHYVVYINVDAKGKWYKFDDELVSKCTAKEAIEQNYGDTEEQLKINIKKSANAYMLSYIQVSKIPNILKEINETHVTSEFIEHLKNIKRIEDVQCSMKYNKDIFSVNIILEDALDTDDEDMTNLLKNSENEKFHQKTFIFNITDTLNEFLTKISDSFKIAKCNFRLWPLVIIEDKIKPVYLDCTEFNLNCTLKSLKEFRNPWYLLMQLTSPFGIYEIHNFNPNQQILLIYKLFLFNSKNYLSMSFRQFDDQIFNFIDEVRIISNDKGTVNSDYKVYEESSGILLNNFDTLGKHFKLKKNETNCFILIFENFEINNEYSYPDFISNKHSRIELTILEKSKTKDQSKKFESESFSLQFLQNSNLEEIALKVCEKLNVQANEILFYKTNSINSLPLEIHHEILFKDIFRTRSNLKLYYQKLLSTDKQWLGSC